MQLFLIAVALLVRLSSAIFADEAGSVDYHLALLGEPGNATTFFHQPVAGSKASLIYTLSERNVIGAVNPRDGSIVWRHWLSRSRSTPRGQISTAEGHEALSTAVNDTVSSWAASDGRYLWDATFKGLLATDVDILEDEQAHDGKKVGDVAALWAGKNTVVKRLDGETGAQKWSYDDTSGSVPHRVTTSGSEIFAVGLSKAMLKGHKIHVSVLDASTGKAKEQITLSSESEIASEEEVLYVGHVADKPVIIWTDASKTTIKVNLLGTKNVASFDIASTGGAVSAAAVKCKRSKSGPSHFLVEFKTASTHWAQVFHIEGKDAKKAKITKAYDLPRLEDLGAFASDVVGNEGYFVRIASEVQLFSSASHGILARWPLNTPKDSPETMETWSSIHAATEVVVRPDSTYAIRSAVLQDSGDWKLIRNGDLQWTRPEQLATIVSAGWVEKSESRSHADELDAESDASPISAFSSRIQRHLTQLAQFPALLQELSLKTMVWLESFVQSGGSKEHSFGFDKEIHAILENGRGVMIDPSNPQRVKALSDNHIQPVKQLQEVLQNPFGSDDAKGGYSFKIEEGGLSGFGPEGSMWHLSTRKGEEVFATIAQPRGEKVASIGKVLGDRNVLYKYLNPNSILVLTKDQTEQRLSVYLLDAISGAVLHSEDYDDVDLSRPINAAITENWFTYSFTYDARLDTLSRGHLLIVGEAYESEFPNDRGPLGASSNYSAIDPSLATPGMLKPHIISQTYHIPEEISHMAITQTQQGITSRQLLVTLATSGAVVGIPHQVLDPRRPVGRASTTKDMEEGLMQYNPMIDFDAKMFLTHTNEVLGIEEVMSSPSHMESTSLIFAYGLDVFGTRVAPSFTFDILGASFNKIQLILTVTALTLGVFVVAPLITRKQTNVLWQSS
ncbi:MAG: hypothetical protein Q9159_006557 [Coniocarpon cinnabarinum]